MEKVKGGVLHGGACGVAVVTVPAVAFNAPVAAPALDLFVQAHIAKIRVVNFECFHGVPFRGL